VFGPGRSEKLERLQAELPLEQTPVQAVEPKVETVSYERLAAPREKRAVPAEVFKDLPVKQTVVIEPEEVKARPELYERIGEERTFEVDVISPQLVKREIVRVKYRLIADRSQPPVITPAPARPVAGGYASAGLLAWILMGK